jgi:hypothetical protein
MEVPKVTEIEPEHIMVDSGLAELRHLNGTEARTLEVVVDKNLENGDTPLVEVLDDSGVAIVRVEPGHASVRGIHEAVASHQSELIHAA